MKTKSSSLLRVVIFWFVVLSMVGCSSSTEPTAAFTQSEPNPTVEGPDPDRVPIAPTRVPSPTPLVVADASPAAIPTVVAPARPTSESMETVPTGPPTANPPPAELPSGAAWLTILHTNDVTGYVDPCG